jgi:hypothetical protein
MSAPFLITPPSNPDWRKDAALRPTDKPKEERGPIEWTTPPDVRMAAVKYVLPLLAPGSIWEPFVGVGDLRDELIRAGRGVHCTKGDFFKVMRLPPHVRIALTNPPWDQLGQVVDRMMCWMDTGGLDVVVPLMRNDHLTADNGKGEPRTRIDALRRADREIDCCWRVRRIPGTKGNGRFTITWVCWGVEPGPVIRVKKEDVR